MNELFTQFAAQYGAPFAMLVAALYWLNKSNREAYLRLDNERNARLDEHRARLDQLTKDVAECNSDRRSLWAQLAACGSASSTPREANPSH
jgi:hypothetical protein